MDLELFEEAREEESRSRSELTDKLGRAVAKEVKLLERVEALRQEARETKSVLNKLQQEHAKQQENLSQIRNDYFKLEKEKNDGEEQWRLESASSWAAGWTDHKHLAEEAYPDLAFDFELPNPAEDESGSEDGETPAPAAEVPRPASEPPVEAPVTAAEPATEAALTSGPPTAAAPPTAEATLPAAKPPSAEVTPAPELPPPELPAPPTFVNLIDP